MTGTCPAAIPAVMMMTSATTRTTASACKEVGPRRSVAYFSSVFVLFRALSQRHQNFSIRYLYFQSSQFIHAGRERKWDLSALDYRPVETRHHLESLISAREAQRMGFALVVQPIGHFLDVGPHVVLVVHAAGA